LYRVKEVKALSGYRLYLKFEDDTSGEVDLSDRIFGPVFEPLKDVKMFARVQIDEFGAVCWPSGADLAPDALYKTISEGVQADRQTK
jgi:hypothetical protein